MAPKGEITFTNGGLSALARRFTCRKKQQGEIIDKLHRSKSDLSLELSKENIEKSQNLPPISEIQHVKCECCGMSEDCTPFYIKRVRENFCGRWICGLCSEAVNEEMGKLGGRKEEALDAHMISCSKFSKIGRNQPVLYQAKAMREILRKHSCRISEVKYAGEEMDKKNKSGIMRTSSCIAEIAKEGKRY